MPRFYFNFYSRFDTIEDRRGVELDSLSAAHRHAVGIMRRASQALTCQSWRGWRIEIADDDGQSLLTVLFQPARDAALPRQGWISPPQREPDRFQQFQ